MDNDTLKARSVELAERANRLKDKASDSDIKDKLDNASDILIQTNNPDRFYLAQSKLENDAVWTEEMRSLAHEIDLADKTIRDDELLSFDETTHVLEQWSKSYLSSTTTDIHETGVLINNALETLSAHQPEANIKDSLDYLISFFETILTHIHSENKEDGIDKTVLVLRNMRNAMLVKRELSVDELKLIQENDNENINLNRVELARESLAKIYLTIKPVEVPR